MSIQGIYQAQTLSKAKVGINVMDKHAAKFNSQLEALVNKYAELIPLEHIIFQLDGAKTWAEERRKTLIALKDIRDTTNKITTSN